MAGLGLALAGGIVRAMAGPATDAGQAVATTETAAPQIAETVPPPPGADVIVPPIKRVKPVTPNVGPPLEPTKKASAAGGKAKTGKTSASAKKNAHR